MISQHRKIDERESSDEMKQNILLSWIETPVCNRLIRPLLTHHCGIIEWYLNKMFG